MNIQEIVSQSKASIDKKDLEILLRILKSIEPREILEIGTWKGYSAEVWQKAFNPDIFLTIEKDKKPKDAIENINKGTWHYLWGVDSHSIKTITMETYLYGGKKFDLLFIDGDHSFEGVKKDWEMYSPLVRKGGVVVFHDVIYTSDDPNAPVQVKPLWDDLKKQYPYVEVKSSLSSTGMGILFK